MVFIESKPYLKLAFRFLINQLKFGQRVALMAISFPKMEGPSEKLSEVAAHNQMQPDVKTLKAQWEIDSSTLCRVVGGICKIIGKMEQIYMCIANFTWLIMLAQGCWAQGCLLVVVRICRRMLWLTDQLVYVVKNFSGRLLTTVYTWNQDKHDMVSLEMLYVKAATTSLYYIMKNTLTPSIFTFKQVQENSQGQPWHYSTSIVVEMV